MTAASADVFSADSHLHKQKLFFHLFSVPGEAKGIVFWQIIRREINTRVLLSEDKYLLLI